MIVLFFFFQAEDGIRDIGVTGVQTCALPIFTLEFVGPLGVAVLGSRRPRDLMWVALAAVGILLLADLGGESRLDPVGVGLALFAGTCWGAYILLSARTGAMFSGGGGLALAMAVAALVALPAGLAQGGADLLQPALLLSGLVVALASSV